MTQFTSKALYMINGGRKALFSAGSFGRQYQATPSEEFQWQQLLTAYEAKKLDAASTSTSLKLAIETLAYHSYPNLKELLLQKLTDADANRQIVFATALWTLYRYEKSYSVISRIFLQNKPVLSEEIFRALINFYDHVCARKFVIDCLDGADTDLVNKARATWSIWAHFERESNGRTI